MRCAKRAASRSASCQRAVTLHYLAGAIVVANVPALYRRFGLPAVTIAAAVLLSAGVVGWAVARIALATVRRDACVSGAGWAAMGAVPVNAAVSPWFVRARPAALGTAYNGASFAGLIFSPLWVALISLLGFPAAAAIIGAVTIVAVAVLAGRYFARTPQQMGLEPDGDAVGTPLTR